MILDEEGAALETLKDSFQGVFFVQEEFEESYIFKAVWTRLWKEDKQICKM